MKALFPILVGILHQHGIEILGVAGNLFSEPGGLVEGLVLVGKFHFGYSEAVVVAVELIDFPGMYAVSVLYEIAGLVYYPGLGKVEEGAYFVNGDFLFPLEACGPGSVAYTLYGDESFLSLYSDADGPFGHAAQITLGDAGCLEGLGLEVAFDQEFLFNFLCHNLIRLQEVCRSYR